MNENDTIKIVDNQSIKVYRIVFENLLSLNNFEKFAGLPISESKAPIVVSDHLFKSYLLSKALVLINATEEQLNEWCGISKIWWVEDAKINIECPIPIYNPIDNKICKLEDHFKDIVNLPYYKKKYNDIPPLDVILEGADID